MERALAAEAVPSAEELERIDNRFERAPTLELLRWAAEQFVGAITFATAFGAEGCALIHMIAEHRLPIDVFSLDTGLCFDETYELWRQLEQRYGLKIRAVRPDVDAGQQAEASGEALWRTDPDLCCQLRKVIPLRGALHGHRAWITAIRREQTAHRANAPKVGWDDRFGLVKINAVADWSSARLWEFIRRYDIPHNPLHHRGYPSIGCAPCTAPVATGEDPRSGRWRGQLKTECGLHTDDREGSA